MPADDSSPQSGINARQEVVALALAAGQQVRGACNSTGVPERTVWGWLADDPRFKARVAELRAALFDAAVGRLALVSGKAALVLDTLLASENENVRLRAATAILELGPRLRESGELAARVAQLENQGELVS